ncbi:MAG TPA: DUF2283 domain-containing protein [Acetobacteraceae bacterium]|nr:DUF2283 domain-containing protein [Acetobacteraceae bacterium]
MAAETAPAPRFQRDTVGGEHYYKVSDKPVAYSVELSDLVVADYDEAGAVRGIEFVGRRIEPIDTYLEKARKATRGPLRQRPKIPT